MLNYRMTDAALIYNFAKTTAQWNNCPMALKATIYKATLNICDQVRNYYEEHQLTLAKHPSETDERLMIRLLAFALYADENLVFGKDISAEGDEPTLWIKDMTGDIDLWIEIGQSDEKTIRKACNRVKQVVLILYGAHTDIWWKHNQRELVQKKNLTVIQIPYSSSQEIAAMAERSMQLTCNIEDNHIMFMNDQTTVDIEPIKLHPEK